MISKTNSGVRSMLNGLDIFGVPIQINFHSKDKFTTRLGGFVSLIVFAVLVYMAVSSVLIIYRKENPQVIQQNELKIPSRVDLNRNNFIFAFGILDANQNPFMDETIYKASAQFMLKVPVQDKNGNTKYQSVFSNIKVGPCTQELFGIPSLQSQFTAIYNYDQLYCIQDIDNLYLEGQVETNIYSGILITISTCQGKGCADPQVIENKIKNRQMHVYYSDYIVQAENYQNPFIPYASGTYYSVNTNALQIVSFTYMNTHVNDDIGLIGSDIQQQSQLLFSQQSAITGQDTSLGFFKLIIYLEKSKELNINRTYTKLSSVISQIGGFYNILFFVGCILAKPYTSLQLKKELINQTFTFSMKENKIDESNQMTKQGEQFKDYIKEEKSKVNNKENLKKNEKIKLQNSIIQNVSPKVRRDGDSPMANSLISKKEDSPKQNQQSGNISQSSDKDQTLKYELFQKIKKGISQTKKLSIQLKDFIYYYFSCFKRNKVSNFIDFSQQKITEYTDINFIVNKILEFEKFKHLFLNENQLQLFEFISKPKVSQEIIDIHLKQLKQKIKLQQNQPNLNQQVLDTSPNNNCQQQTEICGNQIQSSMSLSPEFNLLRSVNYNEDEKVEQTLKAYQQIYKNQQNISSIDIKLLKLLDRSIAKKLERFAQQQQQQQQQYQLPQKQLSNFEDLSIQNIKNSQNLQQKQYVLSRFVNSEGMQSPLSVNDNSQQNKKFQLKDENFQTPELEESNVLQKEDFLRLNKYKLDNGPKKNVLFNSTISNSNSNH
ncbi:transmembrane protein, putative (macronuclear) [Tetrahymena thermophila SB210]|uniref:Transmembrane protein, putative n=1 Tax=Tetrahymena thermophila (strain SB210) TaxID=312017 RepID=Q22N90_TETTS|nr:transmembrane protein, putative [Tetrahymena thermophila SB210]EAR86895.1 transmembrane protein, putative [Tetrahymena thermophila SB210]|eukprot:XP_001007140.1 transmembrane protein, putative [Tetrahymena thermophila SB210]